jgi:glycosyltransferase involved in cell wall biosynthesis
MTFSDLPPSPSGTPPRLRIAFLDSWLQAVAEGSGTAAAIGGLAQALQRRGYQVDRILPGPNAPRNLLLRRLWYNLTLPQRLAQADYDLYVGFDIDGFRWAARSPVPYVCCIQGVLAEEARQERGWSRLMLGLLSRLERLNARRAGRVASISQYCCEMIHHHYGVSRDRLHVFPEGITLADWTPAEEADRHPYRILCVARQYPRKRVRDLVDAFPRVLHQVPQAELVIIGDGPQHRLIQQRIATHGLQDRITLLGALPTQQEVQDWYSRSSIFCLPTVQEGFGIVFLEAMAQGLPIVSTDATAIPEVVPHRQAGILVPPRDVPALAEALVELLKHPDLRQQYGRYGQTYVQGFSWERAADAFLAAIGAP